MQPVTRAGKFGASVLIDPEHEPNRKTGRWSKKKSQNDLRRNGRHEGQKKTVKNTNKK